MQKVIIRNILFVAVSALIILGCYKESDEPVVIDDTIAGKVLKDTNFSYLETLIGKANLAFTLKGAGPFTLFAPDNAAFRASGFTLASVSALTQPQAQNIVLYHTLNSKVSVSGLPAGPQDTIITFSGDSVFVTKNANVAVINSAKITQADMEANNGIIHKIDRVLIPPAGNITETAIANGSDSLAKVIARATNDTTGDADLKNTLNAATITLFAPTDSAFIHFMTDSSFTDINDISIPTLVQIVKYHVTDGRIFSIDLTNGPLTMLAGGNTTIGLTNGIDGGPTITGNNSGAVASNIITTDITFRNGIAHLIDKVLTP